MARKALIMFALLLAAALCFVASAQDPQSNKQGGGGGGGPPVAKYGHVDYYPRGPGYYPPGHHGGYDPYWYGHHGPHCRWGCCHRGYYGECRRCC